MKNHEHYIDRTVEEAIRKTDQSGRKKRRRPWGDWLTYRIGEVVDPELIQSCGSSYIKSEPIKKHYFPIWGFP